MEDARGFLRSAAKIVLALVGSDAGAEPDATEIATAVGAGAVDRVVAAARERKGGGIAIGIAIGAAVGAGALYLASPEGRAAMSNARIKAREFFHRLRGSHVWRKPAPVEIPPPA